MKKTFHFCYYALSLFLVLNSACLNNSTNSTDESSVDSSDYQIILNDYRTIDNYVIRGNYTSLNESEVENLLADQENIYIFYDLDISDNTDCAQLLSDANAVVYFYKNGIPSIHRLQSETTNKAALLSEIDDFVTEKIHLVSKSESQLSLTDTQETTTAFKDLFDGSFRQVKKPYGYIDCNFSIKKYRANDVSSLYLLESDIAFTPGQAARNENIDGYANWSNKAGYLHIKACESSKKCGTPVFKDAYPTKSPHNVFIGSTYSSGSAIGYSRVNGFSLSNTSSADFLYAYNKNYTNVEPAFSDQKSADDLEKYEWNYTYDTKRDETNHLQTGFLYEMNNEGHNMSEGNVMIRFEYSMTVENANKDTNKFSHFYLCNFDSYIPKSEY